jgi:Tfp pilus assembly protein PilO
MALGWKRSYYRYKDFFLNISALYKEKADLRAFLEIVMSITAVIVFLLFALKPTALTIISLLKQISGEKTTLVALTQKVDDLNKAKALLAQNQNYIPNINLAVPSLPNPDILSKQISGLASKNSIQVLGIAVNQVALVGSTTAQRASSDLKAMPEGASEMPFSISVKGDYANLISFIKDFENLRVAIKIDSLGISSSNTDTGRVIVAVISGRVPFSREK